MTIPADLTPLLALVDSSNTAPIEYVIGGSGLLLGGEDRESAAQLIADTAMKIACGKSSVLERWRRKRDGGPAEVGSSLKAVETYVGIAFGHPNSPPNADHLQGHVAELIWNLLIEERTTSKDGRKLVRAHTAKADPLEPGGDGLVIYRDSNGDLVFRLWEIKKHNARARVSSTINRASNQLAQRGHEYLAKLAGPETIAESGPLGEFYANIVEFWFDRSERAGIGVAIGTSDSHAPSSHRAFGSLNNKFPDFSRPSQTEGIVVAMPDFPNFANRVKEIVWSGL